MEPREDQTRYAKRIAAALTQAFNPTQQAADAGTRAVAPIMAKVGIRQQDALLYVALEPVATKKNSPVTAESDLDPQILLPQLKASFITLTTELQLEWVKLVKVSGRMAGQTVPLWQEDLLFPSAPPIANTLMRPVPTLPLQATLRPKTPPLGDVNVSIGGDMSGQLVIGNDNQLHSYTYNVSHGGVLNVAAAPTIQPRPTPLNIKPKPFVKLLDRQTVLPSLRETLGHKLPIELYAEPGFGKTALMRHLCHEDQTTHPFADGVVYLPVGHQPAADLLQSLYDLFYQASPPFKPSYGEVQQSLNQKDALVILNGLTLDKEQGEWLLAALPNCTFLLVSQERIYWQDGIAIALEGLPFPESTALIQMELGRVLTDAELIAAKELWTLLAGNPLQLRRVAAQVKENKQQSLVYLVTAINAQANASEEALFQEVARTLTPQQKKVLALMGAMGGLALTAQQSMAISQVPETATVLTELVQLNLVITTASNGFRLCTDLTEIVPQTFNAQPWLGKATDYFTSQGVNLTDPSSTEAMIHLLEWTQNTGQWQQSLALARNLDPTLSLNGQWAQWQQVLNSGLQAAERASDEAAIAWAKHQLGSCALGMGDRTGAATLLSQAIQLREQLGDLAGAAVSRHNLGLLIPPLVEGISAAGALGSSSVPGTRRWLTGGMGAIAGLTLVGTVATGVAISSRWIDGPGAGQLTLSENQLDFGVRTRGSASDPQGITLTNTGEQPLALAGISLSSDGDFSLNDTASDTASDADNNADNNAGNCKVKVSLAPEETCELWIVFNPQEIGKRIATVTISAGPFDTDKSNQPENHDITLKGTGEAKPLPGLSFDAATLDFGTVEIEQPAEKTVTITNDGNAPLDISEVTTLGAQAKDFKIKTEQCKDDILAPQENCSITLVFIPTKAGDRTARLKVISNIDSKNSELELKGIGELKTPSSAQDDGDEPDDKPKKQPPIARDDSSTVLQGESIEISVLNNDTDPTKNSLTITDVKNGESGTTTLNNNTITYTHDGSSNRPNDSFTYTVRNSDGESEAT
ncbi:MAG: choice-of-anchor D domain-containing protein, partial [Cyanobacteria bacterium J06649_4]